MHISKMDWVVSAQDRDLNIPCEYGIEPWAPQALDSVSSVLKIVKWIIAMLSDISDVEYKKACLSISVQSQVE